MVVLGIITGGIIVLVLLRSTLSYLYTIWSNDLIARKIVVQLRTTVYDKLQRLSFRFFDDNESGSIINRVTSDVQNVAIFLTSVLFGTISVLICLVVFLIDMAQIHVKLTFVMMATMPALGIVTFIFSRMARARLRVYHELNDRLVLTLDQTVASLNGTLTANC